MIIIPSTQAHKPRRKKIRPAESAGPAPLAVDSVQNVSYDGTQLHMEVVFNTTPEQPLGDISGADPAKWNARWDDTRWTGVSLTLVAYDRIALVLDVGGGEAGGHQLGYTNAPSDVSDTGGRMLPAFEMEF